MKKKLAIVMLAATMVLAGCGAGQSGSEPSEPAKSEKDYTITVTDQNGEPVPEVYLNICTDTMCEPRQTDDSGIIQYEGDPAVTYHLQLIKAPEGYSFDPELEIFTEAGQNEITIEIVKE